MKPSKSAKPKGKTKSKIKLENSKKQGGLGGVIKLIIIYQNQQISKLV